MKTPILTESFSAGGNVDSETGVISGVKVLGEHSKNGRRYRPSAMKAAVDSGMYEDVAINVDHNSQNPGTRGWQERIATVKNVRFIEGSDGASLVGDVHVRQAHPLAPMLIEDASNKTDGIGLSHSVRGQRETVGDVMEITNIDQVVSVDLVQNPATTRNLFEQVENTMTLTLQEFTAGIDAEHESRKALDILTEQHSDLELEFQEDASDQDKLKTVAESIYAVKHNAAEILNDLAGLNEQETEEDGRYEALRDMIAEAVKDIASLQTREDAREVLESVGAPVTPVLLEEMVELGDKESMKKAAAELPPAKLRPQSKPILENTPIELDESYKPGLDNLKAALNAG